MILCQDTKDRAVIINLPEPPNCSVVGLEITVKYPTSNRLTKVHALLPNADAIELGQALIRASGKNRQKVRTRLA